MITFVFERICCYFESFWTEDQFYFQKRILDTYVFRSQTFWMFYHTESFKNGP